jgi:peptidoglycan/LPS O-acetylase OafA/YrhL
VTIVLALLSYRFIEKPWLDLKVRFGSAITQRREIKVG